MRVTNLNLCNTNTISAGTNLFPYYLSWGTLLSMHALFQQLPDSHTYIHIYTHTRGWGLPSITTESY